MAFTELRQYFIKPGKMDAWVKFFEEEIVPFQQSQGMTIHGSFRGEADDSLFIWMRSFESEEQREAQYAAVYGSETWKNQFRERVADHIDRDAIKVLRIVKNPQTPSLPILP